MEKEEKCLRCSLLTMSKIKMLIAFGVINVILWFIYYNDCFPSYFNKYTNNDKIKPIYAPIYNIPLFHIPLLNEKDMAMFYLEVKSNIWCLKQGVDLAKSKRNGKCVCTENWFGFDCGIPASVWKSSFLQEGKNANFEIKRRKKPRRIIVFFAVDDHSDLLDINIENAFSLVDVFLTIEEKDHYPSILNLVKEGYLADYQSKIIPIKLNKSYVIEKEEHWSVFMLNELWEMGWKRLSDFRPDDIFMFSHVSSIISNDVLLFLKLYDGFPEPFFFELRPLLFKFWREMKSNSTNSKLVPFKPLGCTFQYIVSLCNYEIRNFFSNSCNTDLHQKERFEKNFWTLKYWTVGNFYVPSGWQCSLCCNDECIKKNIEKYRKSGSTSLPLRYFLGNTSVIEHLIEKTNLFDSKDLSFEIISNKDHFLAPNIVLSNAKYSHLIGKTL
ncbi:beta-1,4-mannosyl-glycoprotein 4-beta-N-acetylglucosaminyltransferase [Caerostris darwini]|uniref:Beta-1,4-mannosyl-glycoprotein 4-beta-N-acetylglucosaminyltransferase n=1 Tax=Caerostris darwini TaxID=1538125 RepID=A0AAV4P5N5_9ARAC|nr:beta-1,4-mannosyl-glycoprotein 4-beta-N-acetylglucosaminyltransferase [Caerostris darwini]